MKTLVIYNSLGKIIFSTSGTSIENNYNCLVADIENGKELVSVDTENNKVITKDKDTRIEDIKTYLDNTDQTTVANVEKTILETEKNKVVENGGM
ncbi:hypothetical protein FDC58_10760 [Clostridium botulinum]|uniref:hypothetical protein n=1 Tax=Clostridium TaxID=1485 RepID=UPI0005025D9D|nr:MULTISPECIES: hypothetical protein [Clostridium]AIY79989.1 hypothetical protein U728_808 [Clostridium botulinum 202F]KAI3344982.1 hypothetical protein CIT17_15315 [Clostridium botulinum]KFX56660.1 hypothetical protein KU40_08085 [Clostridium botulinum]KON14850.1 hypothetical protein ACP50_00130 [Clostridium botulinum]MBY6851155.1 hypothetical protein [Clostridium botulinum]